MGEHLAVGESKLNGRRRLDSKLDQGRHMRSGGRWCIHGRSIPGDKLGCDGAGVPSRERGIKLLLRGDFQGCLQLLRGVVWVIRDTSYTLGD